MRTNLIAVATTFGFAAAAGLTSPGHAQAPGVTAFEGARLIVGDGRVIENGTILMDGTRFTQVGSAAEVRAPAGATRINLAGKTVMSALVDTHVHPSHTPEALRVDLQRRAYYGVSAMMSLGQDESGALLSIRDEMVPGRARYFSSGRGITSPLPGCSTAPYWITTEAEGRKAVDELAVEKVDIVKIFVDDWPPRPNKKLTPAVYGALIDEAHKQGLRVTAHMRLLEDAKGLLRAGVDAFAHSVRDRDIDEEGLALFKERAANLVVNPNLPDRGVKVDLSWLRPSMSDAEMDQLEKSNTDRPQAQAAFAIQARNTAKLAAAGIRLVLGTDGNRPYGPHEEIADMVTAGLTPMQVIIAATRNSAEFLRMDSGTLEAGRSADLIVLDANPLDEITNTRKIDSVYLRGTKVDRGPGKGGGIHANSALCQ